MVCICILLAASMAEARSYSRKHRKLTVLQQDDWQEEWLAAELKEMGLQQPMGTKRNARRLGGRDDWTGGRKLKRSSQEAKRIKDDINKLKRKLSIIDHGKKTQRYFANVDKHKRETRKLKRQMTKHLNQNMFRALVMQKILGSPASPPDTTMNQQNPFGLQVSPALYQQPAQQVQITPKIRSLLLKNLTVQDFDAIAKNKLTVAQYSNLLNSTQGLPARARKERFLSMVVDSFSSVLNGVSNFSTNASTAVNNIVSSPYGKYIGPAELGMFAGLKHRNNHKFAKKRERLLKEIEMFETVGTLIEQEKQGANMVSDKISSLVTRTKNVADNLSYRFDNKCKLFGWSAY